MPSRGPRFTEEQVRAAVGESKSWAETLRRLNYCSTGGNSATLKKYVARWAVSTDHFDPYAGVMDRVRRPAKPLDEVLVERSTYSRGNLKRRLYDEGLKQPECELWAGRGVAR